MDSKIYTVPKLADYLEISERTVRKMLTSKELKGFKKLNKWFVTHKDLMTWLRS